MGCVNVNSVEWMSNWRMARSTTITGGSATGLSVTGAWAEPLPDDVSACAQ
jgi:hypothetical protein